jgi:predicted phosphohydrolase
VSKIQFCSDLHLEFDDNWNFIKNNPIVPAGDILVIAGDLCYVEQIEKPRMKEFFLFLSDSFRAVYYVPGNHEFYGSTDVALLDKPLCEKICDNVFLVNNHIEKIDDVVLIFSTLWTHLYGRNIPAIKSKLNDFHLIRHNEEQLSVAGYNRLHETSVKFITEAIQQSKPEDKIVVVTHHLPSFDCIAPEFEASPLNLAFASNLNRLIESSNIQYWIYGHSHSNVPVQTIGNTQLISNTLGYVSLEEHHLLRVNAIINL